MPFAQEVRHEASSGDLEAGRPESLWARAPQKGTQVDEQAVPMSVSALWGWPEPLSGPHSAGAYIVRATYEKPSVSQDTLRTAEK